MRLHSWYFLRASQVVISASKHRAKTWCPGWFERKVITDLLAYPTGDLKFLKTHQGVVSPPRILNALLSAALFIYESRGYTFCLILVSFPPLNNKHWCLFRKELSSSSSPEGCRASHCSLAELSLPLSEAFWGPESWLLIPCQRNGMLSSS